MTLEKINNSVLHTSVKNEIANKVTQSQLLDLKSDLENQINDVYSSILRKPPVPTFVDIRTVYPTAQEGWTVTVDDTNVTYQYDEDNDSWFATTINAIPKATTSTDGLMTKELVNKLLEFENNGGANKTPQELLDDIKTVDGANSGLDADLLDGKQASEFASSTHNHDGTYYKKNEVDILIGGKMNKGDSINYAQILDPPAIPDGVEINVGTLNNALASGEKLKLKASSTTTNAPLSIGVGSTPNTVEDGDIWINSNGLAFRHNGVSRSVWHNGSYSAMTSTEATTGTGTTSRFITPERLKEGIQALAPVKSVNGQTGDVTIDLSSFATKSELDGLGHGDMSRSIYDRDNDGTVDFASSAYSLVNARYIDGIYFDAAADVKRFAICDTAAETQVKEVTVDRLYSHLEGLTLIVKFTHANTHPNPQLKATPWNTNDILKIDRTPFTDWIAGGVYTFVFDGLAFILQSNHTTKDANSNLTISTTPPKNGLWYKLI